MAPSKSGIAIETWPPFPPVKNARILRPLYAKNHDSADEHPLIGSCVTNACDTDLMGEVGFSEDCVAFNPATSTVGQASGSWKVMDGNHWLFDFGAKKAEADQTLEIIKKYGFTRTCFVGRPNPSFTSLRQ